jgi:hypothetical protein
MYKVVDIGKERVEFQREVIFSKVWRVVEGCGGF